MGDDFNPRGLIRDATARPATPAHHPAIQFSLYYSMLCLFNFLVICLVSAKRLGVPKNYVLWVGW